MLILTLLGLAARSVGLLLLVLLGAVLLTRASASTRRVVWLVGFTSVMILPFVWRLAPPLPVPADRIPGYMNTVRQPIVTDAIYKFADLTESRQQLDHSGESVMDPAPESANPLNVLLVAWAVVTGLLLVRIGWALLAAGLLVRSSRSIESSQLQKLQVLFGIRRRVRLVLSQRLHVPATTGLFRPAILLPLDAVDWPESKMRMVLAHELAHIRQNDWVFSIAAQVACGMYPFNPFAWLCAARLRIDSELAADDRALIAGFKPSAYATSLLEIAQSARRVSPAVVAMARSPRVESRLRAIVDGKRRRGAAAIASILLTSLAAISSCAAIAAFRLGEPQRSSLPSGGAIAFTDDGAPEGWKGPLTVHVIDENGTPRSGVKLHFMMIGSFWVDAATADPEPVTDASGTYVIRPELLRDPYKPLVSHLHTDVLNGVLAYLPGHALSLSDYVKKGDHDATIKLTPSNSVRIPVIGPDGRRLAGVKLAATQIDNQRKGDLGIPKVWRAEAFSSLSDASGFAEFHDIPDGWAVSFSIDDDRFLPTARYQYNPPISGHTEYPALRLAAAATVEGTVWSNGKPVKGVRVQANWAGPSLPRSAVTDSNGHYKIGRVPAGVCDVHYVTNSPDGLVARQRDGVPVRPGQAVSGLDFAFENGVIIRGKIVDENGKPLQLQVEARSPDFVDFRSDLGGNPSDFFGMSDYKTGLYSLRLPPGHYRLHIGVDPPVEKPFDVKPERNVPADFQVDMKSRTHTMGGNCSP